MTVCDMFNVIQSKDIESSVHIPAEEIRYVFDDI